MSPRRRNFSRGSSPRRRSSWEEGPGGGAPQDFSDTTPIFIGAAAAATVDGLTLVRMRGSLYIWLSTAAAAGDAMTGAVGIGITSTEGVAAGIASVPTPITEMNAETWLWWENFAVRSVTDTEAINTGGIGGYRIPIDTKAMRKMNVGDTLYAAGEVGSETGTVTLSITLDTRALLLLS